MTLCVIGFAETYTLGIGIPKYLSPTPPMGSLYSSSWYCDKEEIGMTLCKDDNDEHTIGVKIVINSYFEGTAIIECGYVYIYQYESYGKLYTRTGTGTTKYYIRCGDDPIPPTEIRLPEKDTMTIYESLTLKPTIIPANANAYIILTWTSSDTSVATVNSSGVVTPTGFGNTNITVRTKNNLSATCTVTVEKINATSISVISSKKIIYGDSEKLRYNIYPSNSNNTIVWSSSDETVASVTQEGVVTAKKAGSTNIKVETDNGKSDVCTVTVPPLPDQITLPQMAEVNLNKKVQLNARFVPTNALDHLLWDSDNKEIATIDESGIITGHSVGQARITVRGKNATGVSTTCVVNVIEPEYKLIVWAKDGSKASYRLNERPMLTYSDGNIVLSTTETIVEYNAMDINKYTFEELDDNTNIVPPQTISPADTHLLQQGETVLLEQCEPHSIVQIYAINGKLIDSYTIGGDGTLQISISQYPKGTYLIKTRHLTHKIVKR